MPDHTVLHTTTKTLKDRYGCWYAQREFEKKANPNDKQQAALIDEMRAHIKKVHAAELLCLSYYTAFRVRYQISHPCKQLLQCRA